jgi:Ca-activated chloride channel family protein
MSSPAIIKRRIETASIINFNNLPIRRWEFLNYYHFDYSAPAPGDLTLEAAMSPAADGNRRLHLSVGSELQDDSSRRPMNVTFILDTSSSMNGTPLNLLKEGVHAVASRLRSGDTVSMVEWSDSQTTVLGGYAVTGPDDPMVLGAVDALTADGSTDLFGGLTVGYDLAHQVFDPAEINRVVVITDGGGELPADVEALVTENVTYSGEDGIYLVSAGVYNTSYNDVLLDGLSEAGKGANVFMHTSQEAWRTFGDDFISTMAIAARDVQVRIDLPPGFEQVKFSGEGSSEDPSDIEPQHLAPNDTMVFQQVLELCAPDDVTGDEVFDLTVNWKDPWTFESQSRSATFTYDELMSADPAQLLKARAILKYVDVLQAYSDTPGPDREALVGTAIVDVDDALFWIPDDPDLNEILGLLVQMIP